MTQVGGAPRARAPTAVQFSRHHARARRLAAGAVTPFVPLAARGPWVVTLHGAVIHDNGGYGMLGAGLASELAGAGATCCMQDSATPPNFSCLP